MKNDARIRFAEKLILRNIKKVAATSLPVLEHVQSLRSGIQGEIFENGFSLPVLDRSLEERKQSLRGVYYGALDSRFDYDLATNLAKNNPEIQFDIYSPDQPLSLPTQIRNLSFMDAIPYKELSQKLAEYDFGFMPLSKSKANDGRSPMKLFEMYASGLIVLSSKTVELQRRNLSFVHFFESGCVSDLIKGVVSDHVSGVEARKRDLEPFMWNTIANKLKEFATL